MLTVESNSGLSPNCCDVPGFWSKLGSQIFQIFHFHVSICKRLRKCKPCRFLWKKKDPKKDRQLCWDQHQNRIWPLFWNKLLARLVSRMFPKCAGQNSKCLSIPGFKVTILSCLSMACTLLTIHSNGLELETADKTAYGLDRVYCSPNRLGLQVWLIGWSILKGPWTSSSSS